MSGILLGWGFWGEAAEGLFGVARSRGSGMPLGMTYLTYGTIICKFSVLPNVLCFLKRTFHACVMLYGLG